MEKCRSKRNINFNKKSFCIYTFRFVTGVPACQAAVSDTGLASVIFGRCLRVSQGSSCIRSDMELRHCNT